MTEQHRRRLNTDIATREQWGEIIQLVEGHGGKRAIELLRQEHGADSKEDPVVSAKVAETKVEIEIDLVSKLPVTVDDVIAYRKINTAIWEAERVVSNHWPIGAKLKDGAGNYYIAQQPLNQLKVIFGRKKTAAISSAEIKTWALEASQMFRPEIAPLDRWGVKEDYILEIMIPDLHIGKVGIDDDWDFSRIQSAWFNAVNEMISRAGRVDKIYFPIGNDFIHIDNLGGMTTHGTKVEFQKDWFKLLLFAKQLVLDTITILPDSAEIIMPFVPGNHDEHSVLSMSEMIREAVRDNSRIIIPEANISGRTYIKEGNVFIGWMHGQLVKGPDILGTASHEAAEIWGQTQHRYVHYGHLHKAKREGYVFKVEELDEVKGLEIEICPSLAPTDNWHNSKAYIGNKRRATGFLYHKDKGKVHQFFVGL